METLPPGCRFDPSQEEIILHYLIPAINGQQLPFNIMRSIDIYGKDKEPWNLFNKKEKDVWVLTRLKKKSGSGSRFERAAGCGSWTGANGADITDTSGEVVGYCKYYVYKLNKSSTPPKGQWVMHEYSVTHVDDIVICHIENKEDEKENKKKRKRLDCKLVFSEHGVSIQYPTAKRQCPLQLNVQPENMLGGVCDMPSTSTDHMEDVSKNWLADVESFLLSDCMEDELESTSTDHMEGECKKFMQDLESCLLEDTEPTSSTNHMEEELKDYCLADSRSVVLQDYMASTSSIDQMEDECKPFLEELESLPSATTDHKEDECKAFLEELEPLPSATTDHKEDEWKAFLEELESLPSATTDHKEDECKAFSEDLVSFPLQDMASSNLTDYDDEFMICLADIESLPSI